AILELFKHEVVAHLPIVIKIVNIYVAVVVDLHMGGAFGIVRHRLHIDPFKAYLQLVVTGNDIYAEDKIECKNEGGRHHIRADKPVKTHSAAQDRHNLSLIRHLGRKKDHGDKVDQRRQHVQVERHKAGIILKDNL